MKKKNLLFALFTLGMGVGFFSCISGGNISNFPASPAVVELNEGIGGTAIGTPYGYCAAPGMDSYRGKCVMLSFSVDYDHQPSTLFATASNIQVYETIPQGTFEMAPDSVRIDDYTLPVSSSAVGQWNSNVIKSPYYGGKIFIGIACKDSNPKFRLVYNAQESDSTGVKNLYLLGQPSASSDTISKNYNYAFDIMDLIQYAGRDTTITDDYGTVSYRYVKANLKYFTGMSDDPYSTGPFLFTVFQ